MHGFALPALRAHRRRQAELDYPLVRACPTTEAVKLSLYLDGLSAGDRLAYADQLSSLEEQQAAHPPASNDEIHALIRSFPLVCGFLAPRMSMVEPEHRPVDLRVTPVKVLARILAESPPGGLDGLAAILRLSDAPEARAPAPVVAASLAEVVPVEPRRLRKLLDEAMDRAFAARPERVDKESVRYNFVRPEGAVRVDVAFAAPGRLLHQFNYSFSAQFEGRPKIWMTAYESVWRLAARWDGVTQVNAQTSVAHLASLVEACIDLV
jgi:hypothetical protein